MRASVYAAVWAAVAAVLVTPAPAVSQTGTLRGTVRVEGVVPPPRAIEVTKNHEFCGDKIYATDVVVDQGKLAFAVVYVNGLSDEAAPTEYLLSNSGCTFDPPVLATAVGGTLLIDNQDEVLHNTHLKLARGSRHRTVGNWALSSKGVQISADRPLRRAGFIEVSCDAHPWMHAAIWVFDHPFFSVTREDGAFEIPGLPVGTHTLTVWHAVLGELETDVTVRADATTSVELVYSTAESASRQEGRE